MCFVGINRTYPPENEAVIEAGRQKFLQRRCSVDACNISMTAADCTKRLSVSDTRVQFVPRLASEKPKNAVAIDDCSKQLIRRTVLMEILSRATDLVTLKNKTWNKGGWFYTLFHSTRSMLAANMYYGRDTKFTVFKFFCLYVWLQISQPGLYQSA